MNVNHPRKTLTFLVIKYVSLNVTVLSLRTNLRDESIFEKILEALIKEGKYPSMQNYMNTINSFKILGPTPHASFAIFNET